MLASIIMSNYNYARFLREAIDSALSQDYPHVEVVVVDDGSTDNSREIIRSYADSIIPVFKENGGLASAINAGYAASHGDIICFLDADDIFAPQKVALVAQTWKAYADACLIYHQMQTVDAQKEYIGRPWPHAVWRGNIRKKVERSGGWWPNPPTSGLCFSRSYLDRMLPVPTGPYLVWPDTYLAGAAPFFGAVVGIRLPLTFYRVHGQNSWALNGVHGKHKLEIFQRRLNQYDREFNTLKDVLDKRLHICPPMSLDDHIDYQRHRRALGAPVPFMRMIMMAIRCPALPITMKLRESAKIALNRW